MNEIQLVPISKENDLVKNWRLLYFQSCYEPQELYVEQQVEKSNAFSIVTNLKPIGYILIGKDSTLLELYLEKQMLHLQHKVYLSLQQSNLFNKAWVKSFDPLLLNFCLQVGNYNRIVGYLFRDQINSALRLNRKVSFLSASKKDLGLIENFKWDFFVDEEEINVFFEKGTYLFYHEKEFIGIGTIFNVHSSDKFFDIGVCVKPEHRKKGYGAQIVLQLKNLCYENNQKPICGCAADNIASKKTLEKAGFFSRHTLLEYSFDN